MIDEMKRQKESLYIRAQYSIYTRIQCSLQTVRLRNGILFHTERVLRQCFRCLMTAG